MCQKIPCAHMCAHTGTGWSRKPNHMGRSKAQRGSPVTLALVSNTSMSTSKYEGSLKSPQMEDKQKPEKMYQGSWFVFCCPFAYHEQPWCVVNHSRALLWSMTLPLNPTEWMPAWPGLTSFRLLPCSALTSVWNIDWGWREIWSQAQVLRATRTCHVSGTEHNALPI